MKGIIMRRRSFQVKLVKEPKPSLTAAKEAPKNSPETIVIEVLREGTKCAAGLMMVYKLTNLLCHTAEHIIVTKIK